MLGRVDFLNALSPHVSASDLERIEAAYIFSKYAHRTQQRDSGERYFEHPKSVALMLIELGVYDPEIIILALLHDVSEDTFLLSDYRVRVNFGDRIADELEQLTKRPGEDYHAKLDQAGWRVLTVKMADRLHNLSTLAACPPPKQARKLAETVQHYVPLAERLVALAPSTHQLVARELADRLRASCQQTGFYTIG